MASHDRAAVALPSVVERFPVAAELGELFATAGHELALVGGTVRDALQAGGAALDDVDLDLATSARPEATEDLLRRWTAQRGVVWLTGAAYGTVSARRDDRTVEVTTYRTDRYEPGSRHPEVTYGDTLVEDLERRDLTVNAMAVRLPSGEFVDAFGGLRDLQARVLRTPMDPERSFGDDPLRMVRLARFAARLDAEPDPATEAAAVAMADELSTISAERLRDELSKLLLAPHPRRGVELLVATGLARQFVPELAELERCVDPEHRHKDVYAHSLAVLEHAIALEPEGPDLVLRLAALLHDVGKPATRRMQGSTVTFHHHEMEGFRLVRDRLRALRYDKETARDVAELVKLHLRFHTYKMGWTDAAVRRYVRDAGHLYWRLNALTRADVTTRNARKAARIQRRVDELEERVEALREEEELAALRPALDGRQIMDHLGLEPGPLVGEARQHLLDLRIERGPISDDEAYTELDAWWERQQGDPP